MDRLKEIEEAAKSTQGVSSEQADWLIEEVFRARKIEDAALVWRQSWSGRADHLNDKNERDIATALTKYPRPKAS